VTDLQPATRHLRVEQPSGHPGVAVVTIDRPDVLNALSFELLADLAAALEALDSDGATRAVVLTGAGERAFAAGADIVQMVDQSAASFRALGVFDAWDRIAAVGVPVIAAVRGFALGGGCEIALSCDVIVAADDATFGQPEVRIGVVPGAGASQRLPRLVGQPLAMDLILTGRQLGAEEARAAGLVARVVPAADLLAEALRVADTIAAGPPLAVREAKRMVRTAFEVPLTEGIRRERDAFFALFDTDDQHEGMRAFIEKRTPVWTGR
jgi:enoyl-CoA hydratase